MSNNYYPSFISLPWLAERGSARDQTQGLTHVRRAFHHWAAPQPRMCPQAGLQLAKSPVSPSSTLGLKTCITHPAWHALYLCAVCHNCLSVVGLVSVLSKGCSRPPFHPGQTILCTEMKTAPSEFSLGSGLGASVGSWDEGCFNAKYLSVQILMSKSAAGKRIRSGWLRGMKTTILQQQQVQQEWAPRILCMAFKLVRTEHFFLNFLK